jgi:hypothetical protein
MGHSHQGPLPFRFLAPGTLPQAVEENPSLLQKVLITVAVLPQAAELDIKESDLQITFQRASGAGGQNVSLPKNACQLLLLSGSKPMIVRNSTCTE